VHSGAAIAVVVKRSATYCKSWLLLLCTSSSPEIFPRFPYQFRAALPPQSIPVHQTAVKRSFAGNCVALIRSLMTTILLGSASWSPLPLTVEVTA